jgi:beta-lactamase regulating signal transducer with metallopeptidase domain
MLTDRIITATVYALLHSLWQALVITLMLLIFSKAAKSAGSKIRYSVSFISLFAVLISSALTFYYYFKEKAAALVSASYNITASSEIRSEKNIVSADIWMNMLENYSGIIFTMWFAGMAVFFIKFCIDLYYADSIRKKECVNLPDAVTASFIRIADRLGVKKVVRYIESPLVKVPAVIGFFKPAVILPLGLMSKIPSDQLEAVISHELAHIARNDFLHNLIQSLIEIVYFFNPSILIISKMIRTERENCCDDLAVTQCRDSALLAKGLYNLELLHSDLPKPIMAAGNRNNLLCRIKRLIGKEKDMTKTYSGFFASLTVLTIITVVTGCTLFASGSKEDEKMKEEKTEKIIIIKNSSDDSDNDDLDKFQLVMDSKQLNLDEVQRQLESALKELENLKGDQKIKIEEKVKAALKQLKEHTLKLDSDLKKIKIISGGGDDVMIFTGKDSSKADIKECKEIKIIVKDGDDDDVNIIKKIDKGESTIELDDLWKNLIADGLFKEKSDNLKIEIEDDEIEINGVEIPGKLLEKYRKLLDVK